MTIKAVDLAIVGAGPAGLMAARIAAKSGLETVLIDKKSEIGTPLRCGEAFNQKILERMGIPVKDRYVSSRCTKITIHSPKGDEASFNIPFTLLITDRVQLEKYLGEQAESTGADIRMKTVCSGLSWSDGCYNLKISADGKREDLSARYVIGADGIESRVGRWAGIKTTLKPSEMGKAAVAIIKDVDIEKDRVHAFLGGKYGAAGYAWIFPKGSDRANIGLGFTGSNKRTPLELLPKFVRSQYPKAKIEYQNVGCIPLTMPLKKMHAKNLLLAGDAAHLAIPATGAGIGYGLLSGRMAAQAIAKASECRGNKASELDLEGRTFQISISSDALQAYTTAVLALTQTKFKRSLKFLNKRMLAPDDEIEGSFKYYKMAFAVLNPFPGVLRFFGKDYFF